MSPSNVCQARRTRCPPPRPGGRRSDEHERGLNSAGRCGERHDDRNRDNQPEVALGPSRRPHTPTARPEGGGRAAVTGGVGPPRRDLREVGRLRRVVRLFVIPRPEQAASFSSSRRRSRKPARRWRRARVPSRHRKKARTAAVASARRESDRGLSMNPTSTRFPSSISSPPARRSAPSAGSRIPPRSDGERPHRFRPVGELDDRQHETALAGKKDWPGSGCPCVLRHSIQHLVTYEELRVQVSKSGEDAPDRRSRPHRPAGRRAACSERPFPCRFHRSAPPSVTRPSGNPG